MGAQEDAEERVAWKQEVRKFLLEDIKQAIASAQLELERIDFLWGRIRLSRLTVTPAIKADVRVEGHLVVFANVELKLTKASRSTPITGSLQQYCVLNQILEFHGIVQSQLAYLATFKRFLAEQHDTLANEKQEHVDDDVQVVQVAFESLTRICHELRNAANVLRLPSRRRFPYCTHLDHSFKPSLPQEIIVDFSIHRGELILEAFSVANTQKSLVDIPEGCTTKKELLGCVCSYLGQKVEIIEHASISVPIPQVEEMLHQLEDQVGWLVHVAFEGSEKSSTSGKSRFSKLDGRFNTLTKNDVIGGSERQLSGLKPIVPLKKRGQSFRETKSILASIDSAGRRHLNQYTFLEQLGRGAYGLVLKAESNETKECFAVKIVDKKALKKIRVGRFGNALQSVKKELDIWKRFKHRHIVVLREVIDADISEELYMISELVDGGTVLDDDRTCTPLSPELTKRYFCQLIEGIDFLHENKIIHRDIKPGNLLLKTTEDGEVVLKIADFGVSHEVMNDDDSLRQTAGTSMFMAPEMLTGDNFHGKPVDIWACGVTLYMFVYGRPPFLAQTMTELYGRIQNDPIEYPEVVGETAVDPMLIDLMKHILDKDTVTRYTSRQIRAHPWAWNDFQVSAMKCVTHPDGRRTSFSNIPKSLAGIASVGKSLRGIFGRSKVVLPVLEPRSSIADAIVPRPQTEERLEQ